MHRSYPWFRRSAMAFVALCLATPAMGLDSVTFLATDAPKNLLSTLKDASQLASLGKSSKEKPQDILVAAKAEYGALLAKLYEAGYYGPEISVQLDGIEAAEIAPLDVPTKISTVKVLVKVGPQFTFSQTDVAPIPAGLALGEGFSVGKVAGSGEISEAVLASITAWRELGFAQAAVADQSLRADHQTRKIAANITLAKGPKLRFGALRLDGISAMRDDRVRAIAGLPTGELFEGSELDRVVTRLRRAGVFRSVALTEDEYVTKPDLLGITATLVEERPRRVRFSGEWASQDGTKLGLDWMHRNLLGGAERLTFSSEVYNLGIDTGGLDYKLSAGFARPATFTPDTTLNLGITYDREKFGQTRFTATEIKAGLTEYFSNTLTGTGSLTYNESQSISPFGTSTYRTLSFPFGFSWDTRDTKKNASEGVFITTEIKPFRGLGQSESGTRVVLNARGYKASNSKEDIVLAARIQAGAVLGASLAGTQSSDLFFSGGPATVRGQPYQSLGVSELSDGFGGTYTTGGTYFLGASLEGRIALNSTWGIVGFVDAGRVDTRKFFANKGNWHAGAGAGLRYQTAIGPIRFDIAAPIEGTTGQGPQLYIGLGQAF